MKKQLSSFPHSFFSKRHIFFLALLLSLVHISSLSAETNKTFSQLMQQPKVLAQITPRDISPKTLHTFYASHHYKQFWTDEKKLNDAGIELIKIVLSSNKKGLSPKDYHQDLIVKLLATKKGKIKWKRKLKPQEIASLELALTNAALNYTVHLHRGKLNDETYTPRKVSDVERQNIAPHLFKAATEKKLEDFFSAYEPTLKLYANLLDLLEEIEEFVEKTSEWKTIPPQETIETLNEEKPSLPLIRSRLAFWGDLKSRHDNASMLYSEEVKEAIITFQHRHGLESDGKIGRQTIQALNVNPQERKNQIIANLERLRHLPHTLENRYLWVNVPNYSLQLFENENELINMKVIVGQEKRPTPIFHNTIRYIVFSPVWNVPYTIAVEDKVPELIQDPSYAEKMNLLVYHAANGEEEIDPTTIEWEKYKDAKEDEFPFRFVQAPGNNNALGHMKFMFPNKHAVYLHDTSSRSLFQKHHRAFSSGCIRLEKPMWLAQYLLNDKKNWGEKKIFESMNKPEETTVYIKKPLPIYINYWTAWKNKEDKMEFREDIYKLDRNISNHLLSTGKH